MSSSGTFYPETSGASGESEDGFPTILVIDDDNGSLAERIRQESYLVLEAADWASALHIVRFHSRRIHLLLVGTSMYDRGWEELLKQYRPLMQSAVWSADPGDPSPSALHRAAITTVREYFASRRQTCQASA